LWLSLITRGPFDMWHVTVQYFITIRIILIFTSFLIKLRWILISHHKIFRSI
jgi:hypothetical protein